MPFCTQCGHHNPDKGRFCEECGQPLTERPVLVATPQPAGVAHSASRSPSKRMLIMAGVAVAGVLLVGGGLAYMLMPESASTGTFAKVIERALDKQPDLLRNRYCLGNFAYDKNPIYINAQDRNTRRWLELLVNAGVYAGPETITTGSGFFTRTQLKYEKTPEAANVIRDKQLCFADGVTLKSVDSFTPPQKMGGHEVSKATVTLALKNPAPWSQTDEARSMNERFVPESSETFTLVLREGKWELLTGGMPPSGAARTQPKAVAADEPGFFAKLFSFGQTNPVLGTWAGSMMGVELVRFEFRPDSMRTSGVDIKVRYKIEGSKVIVYAEGETAGMVLRVIDKNNLMMGEGLAEVKLVRAD
jgi:hypothetical protein